MSQNKKVQFPLVGHRKHIEHSDPDAIKTVNDRVLYHGSTIYDVNNVDKSLIIERRDIQGHVAVFSINAGQEVFSEKISMVMEGFENSKLVGTCFRKLIDEYQLYGTLPSLVMNMFSFDSYRDNHFGIAASSLVRLHRISPEAENIQRSTLSSNDTLNNAVSLKSHNFGLFMGVALIRHSCNPNVEIFLHDSDDTITVRATRAIPRGAELTRDWVSEHYYHNYYNNTFGKTNNTKGKRKNHLDLEGRSTNDDVHTSMNRLIGGLTFKERESIHLKMFGCVCTCYWCNQCRSSDVFRKSDDFIRGSINSTYFNVEMVDITSIPDAKIKLLRAVIKLMEDAYKLQHYCNIFALAKAYVQLSAALLVSMPLHS